MNKINKKIDLVVIGGGPAGLMAGFSAKNKGADVVIVEKGDPGSKILVSGNGRCNFTNKAFKLQELVKNYEKDGDFLYRSLSQFGPKEAINFFESRGVKAKIENSKVFPESDNSQDILEVFKKELSEDVLKGEVVDFLTENERVDKILVKINDKVEEIEAKNFLLATGGKSYPHLGADGFGFEAAKKMGHKVLDPFPALTPLVSEDKKVKNLQGIALKEIELSYGNNAEMGDLIFTHFGLSGPAVLNLSLKIKGEVEEVRLKLLPKMNFEEIDKKLIELFKGNKSVKNCLSQLFPENLVKEIFSGLGFSLTKKANKLTKGERHKIVKKINNIEIKSCKPAGFDRALVTGGGVNLSEIDSKTMRSQIIGNLFFAGEVINLVGRTGGFNLQMCWSTGRLAGKEAVKN